MLIVKQSLKVQSFQWSFGVNTQNTSLYDSGAVGTYVAPIWIGSSASPAALKYITVNVLVPFTSASTTATIKIETFFGLNLFNVALNSSPGSKLTSLGIYGGDPIAAWNAQTSANTYVLIGASPLNFLIGTQAITAGSAIFYFEYYQ